MIWPDVLAVLLVLLAAVAGLRRGLWLELVLFVGVILAVLTSAWVTPRLFAMAPVHAGFFGAATRWIIFVATALVFAGLYTWLGERTRGLVPDFLVPLDRALGTVLGAGKGVLLAGVVFFLLLQPWVPGRAQATVGESHWARAAVLVDAILLDRMAAKFPYLDGAAQAFGQSLHPQTHPAKSAPVVVHERTGHSFDA
jgi:hypothetical protein